MAHEYAPDALLWLADEIVDAIPSAEFSGIAGDPSHTYGYHRCRNVLPSSDYSVQTGPDRAGDGNAASALDISYNATWMRTITKRLLDSAKDQNDLRLNCCREFFGTLDGDTVTGWDTYYGEPSTSDDSHLWHVHISVLRKYANDRDALAGVLSVIKGDDDVSAKDLWNFTIAKIDKDSGTSSKMKASSYLAYNHEYNKQQNQKLDTLIGLVSAGTGADPAAIRAAMEAELKKSEARERAERAAEYEAMADQIATAVAEKTDHDLDTEAVREALRDVLGSLDQG
jgi:hypothetical protein